MGAYSPYVTLGRAVLRCDLDITEVLNEEILRSTSFSSLVVSDDMIEKLSSEKLSTACQTNTSPNSISPIPNALSPPTKSKSKDKKLKSSLRSSDRSSNSNLRISFNQVEYTKLIPNRDEIKACQVC